MVNGRIKAQVAFDGRLILSDVAICFLRPFSPALEVFSHMRSGQTCETVDLSVGYLQLGDILPPNGMEHRAPIVWKIEWNRFEARGEQIKCRVRTAGG